MDHSDNKADGTAGPSRWATLAVAVLFIFVQWWFYWQHRDHYFQGDTLSWFALRYDSLSAFLHGFITSDPGGWYRPLTQRTVESLGFPLWGLQPAPYRWIIFAVFAVNTILMVRLAYELSNSRLAATVAGIFFCTHSVNAYTTYDLAYLPELGYAAFYICATTSFVRQLEGRANSSVQSVLWFVAALLCKESAITLPFVLLILQICKSPERRFTKWIFAIKGHLIVAAAYLFFILGVLGKNHTSFAALQSNSGLGYVPSLGGLFTNIPSAILWAANLPYGPLAQWRDLRSWMVDFMWLWFVIVAALVVWRVIRGDRIVMFGLGWFICSILPTLALGSHFLPYYLYLPLAGLALALGRVAETFASTSLRKSVLVCGLFVMIVVCHRSVLNDARDNTLLGGSARIAEHARDDLRSQEVPLKTLDTLVVLAPGDTAIPWYHGNGGLFPLLASNNKLVVQYWTGEAPDPRLNGLSGAVVFADRGRLLDVSKEFREDPKATLKSALTPIRIVDVSLDKGEPQQDDWVAQYTINDGPLRSAPAFFDKNVLHISVPIVMAKGLYDVLVIHSKSGDWQRVGGYAQVE